MERQPQPKSSKAMTDPERAAFIERFEGKVWSRADETGESLTVIAAALAAEAVEQAVQAIPTIHRWPIPWRAAMGTGSEYPEDDEIAGVSGRAENYRPDTAQAAEPPQLDAYQAARYEAYADCERIAREQSPRQCDADTCWIIAEAIAAKRKEVCGE